MTSATLFGKLMGAARRHRKFVIACSAALAVVGILLVRQITFDSNVLALLPREGPAIQRFEKFLASFGSLDYLYVLFEAPGDASVDDYEDVIEAYADGLRRSPEIASVDSELFGEGKDPNYFFERALLFSGNEGAVEALKRFEPGPMRSALQRSRELLTVPSRQARMLVQEDPLGFLRLLQARLARGRTVIEFDPGQKGYVTRDGRSRLVIARPVRPPFDTDFAKRLAARLASIETAARAAAAPDGAEERPRLRIDIAGSYRVSLETERVVRRESLVNAASSLVGILILVLAVFRTPWILLLGTLPLVLAALLALGIVGNTSGALSPATSGAAAMLFGLGIDSVVLVYHRYLEEVRNGHPADVANGRLATTGVSVALANLTTAASFFALLFIDFPSLSQLGLLVGLGVLLSCLLTLTLQPALMAYIRPARLGRSVSMPRLGRFVTRRSRAILWSAAALTIVLGVAAAGLKIDTGMEPLAVQTEGVAIERDVARRFGLLQDVVLAMSEGPDLDRLLTLHQGVQRAVERHAPNVAVGSPLLLLPLAAEQAEVGQRIREASLTPATADARFREAARQAGFHPDAFEGFLKRLPSILNPDQRVTYDDLVKHGFGDLALRYVVRTPRGFLVVSYLYPGATDDQVGLQRIVEEVSPDLEVTSPVLVNRELARRFPGQFAKGVAIGTIAVAALVFVTFRRWRWTALSLLPLAVGFIWAAGALALLGVRLDLFCLFAAMTFIGISVDYGIHILERVATEPATGIAEIVEHTGTAILIAWATTIIGFGSTVTSSYGPLRSFGITSVVAITSCLVVAVFVLPALIKESGRR